MTDLPVGLQAPKPSPLLQWFTTHLALIVSLASLCVALASFALTYIVQARDAYYKELSIRPAIDFMITPDSLIK